MSDAADRLRDAAREVEAAEDAVAERGEDTLRRVQEAYDEATALLDRYEGRATGSGGEEFQAFVEFQDRFSTTVEGLDDDLPHRDAFETALDSVDKRRLSESDFESAREALAPAREAVAVLERRREAYDEYSEARRDAGKRLSAVREEIEDLEHLQELGDADLDAPVDRLRDPIEAYDDAVVDAFRDFRLDASAREVLDWAASAGHYHLVDVPEPPQDLKAYVDGNEAGDLTIPKLTEYAGYSRSKLDHYVDDPDELKRRVATERTYLDRLDGTSLTIGWPPAPAEETRYRVDDLVSLVSRFTGEDVVARLREIADLARDEDTFSRLRTAAVARAELGDRERERVKSGAVQRELEELRDEKAELERVLDEYDRR